MTTPDQGTASLQLVAGQLAAYLATPGLPDEVEMSCLLAADELQRAGVQVLDLPPAPAGVAQILDTLLDLPLDLFASAPVLDAVAHLNDAADALLAV